MDNLVNEITSISFINVTCTNKTLQSLIIILKKVIINIVAINYIMVSNEYLGLYCLVYYSVTDDYDDVRERLTFGYLFKERIY